MLVGNCRRINKHPCQVETFNVSRNDPGACGNWVKRIASLDKKGEFFIVVIGGTGEEKKFKVKTKHFNRLP